MDDSLNQLSVVLGKRGYRMTKARRLVVQTLVATGGHVSADELAELLRSSGFEVGRMTVYRTLDLLTELGLVRPIYQGTGAAHFILLLDGHHHHFVCTRCNAVIEVDSCLLTDLEGRLVNNSDFEVHGHLLEIFGICNDCRAKTG